MEHETTSEGPLRPGGNPPTTTGGIPADVLDVELPHPRCDPLSLLDPQSLFSENPGWIQMVWWNLNQVRVEG